MYQYTDTFYHSLKYTKHMGLDKQICERNIVNNFLPICFNICFGCSKEPSHWDGSFEYPQNMFWLRNKKINFLVSTENTYMSLVV